MTNHKARGTIPSPHEFIQVAVIDSRRRRLAGHLYRLTAEAVRVLFSRPDVPVCAVGE